MNEWTAQINDLVGGWIVTRYPHPLSEHDRRKDGDPSKFGYIAAECYSYTDATLIARLLNFHDLQKKVDDLPQEVVEVFEDFWAPIVRTPEGHLDIAQVMRELHDYSDLLKEVPKAYDHVTQGRISKPNTLASEVIRVHDEVCVEDGD